MAALRCLRSPHCQPRETVLDIALDGQMGKQRQVLKHIADSAKLRRNIDSARTVEKDLSR